MSSDPLPVLGTEAQGRLRTEKARDKRSGRGRPGWRRDWKMKGQEALWVSFSNSDVGRQESAA